MSKDDTPEEQHQQHDNKEIEQPYIGKKHTVFKTLVLSGAAFKGFAFIGCLQFLEEQKVLPHLHNFVGSSAGSIISFLVCLGYTSKEILKLCHAAVQKYIAHAINYENLFNFIETMGLDDGSLVQEWLKDCLEIKAKARDLTFIDFAKLTGKNLIICASDLTLCEDVFFGVDETPHMSVIRAIRASISIPWVFTPVKDPSNGHLYVDAGLLNHFPIERIKPCIARDTLGIRVLSKPFQMRTPNIFSFTLALLESVVSKVNKKDPAKLLNWNVVIDIPDESDMCDFNFETLKLNVNVDQLNVYVERGYASASHQLHD